MRLCDWDRNGLGWGIVVLKEYDGGEWIGRKCLLGGRFELVPGVVFGMKWIWWQMV